jgi:hypothetical protein
VSIAYGPLHRSRIRWLLALLIVAALGVGGWIFYVRANSNPGCEVPRGSSACTRIFFIGNSYTSVNDLPTMFSNLAWSGGHRVETAVRAPGGWTLLDHSHSSDTKSVLASSKWDIVVLQEQSEIPSVESMRQSYMYPGARDLVPMIRDDGARPMFFVTWGHRNGSPINRLPDYSAMQSAIDDAYLFIAREQSAAVAPVGFAWASVANQDRDAGLWQDDGSHPTTKGTYLAAAVFYAAVFLKSPIGLKFHAGLSAADAEQVQEAAAGTVLADPARWRLPVIG